MQKDVKEKAKKIKMILMDVDGVMTDGKIIFGNNGVEAKQFDAKDGVGIKIAQRLGIQFGLITGRSSEAVARRAEELAIEEVHQGQKQKIKPYEDILNRHSLKDEEVCFIGDDVVDVPIMRRVGFPVAVADAHPDIIPFAVHTTACRGGQGAIREVIDLIIKAQGKWDEMMKRYL
jgi:3-deoxy-D-manno-octulosonate 8-phosphate phosphatase (KDO 8-P phosphatase)